MHTGMVRTIDEIDGDDIYWSDKIGTGRCGKNVFRKKTATLAADSPPPPLKRKPIKRFTHDVLDSVKEEMYAVRVLRAEIAKIEVDSSNDLIRNASRIGLWQLVARLKQLEEDIQKFIDGMKRVRMATDIKKGPPFARNSLPLFLCT